MAKQTTPSSFHNSFLSGREAVQRNGLSILVPVVFSYSHLGSGKLKGKLTASGIFPKPLFLPVFSAFSILNKNLKNQSSIIPKTPHPIKLFSYFSSYTSYLRGLG